MRLHDPLVTYQIGRIRLQMPMSHELPYYRRAYPQYLSNLGRIAAAVHQKYPGLRFIDIGANVGDTAAMARQHAHFPILCIEGSPTYLPLLQRNLGQLQDMEIEGAFVGGTSGAVRARVEMTKGTARLAMDGLAAATIPLRSLHEIIQDHLRFEAAKLLKSDTDGMDLQIITGAADYLGSARPALFFEYDPDLTARAGDIASRVFDVLEAAGYRYALVYENTGDFMFFLDLRDKRLVADMDAFFSGRDGVRYADICAFHEEDSDLASTLHQTEVAFFRALRGVA